MQESFAKKYQVNLAIIPKSSLDFLLNSQISVNVYPLKEGLRSDAALIGIVLEALNSRPGVNRDRPPANLGFGFNGGGGGREPGEDDSNLKSRQSTA